MGIIIVEGCDCVGKTTFAEKLSERTGYEIVKGSSFEISELGADGMFEYMMKLLSMDNIIIDRFFYSNLVYGILYKYPMMNEKQYLLLKEKMDERALVLYLHSPIDVITSRMKNRGDEYVKVLDLNGILRKYREFMHSGLAPKTMLSLDTTYINFNITTSMVSEIIKLQETSMHIRNN